LCFRALYSMHLKLTGWLQVFPHVAADNRLYAYTLNGYWMDVGQPKDYLKGGCVGGCMA
jgi:NDP-sugar pyrophosphorylase family protein